jgi:hypothetical protein
MLGTAVAVAITFGMSWQVFENVISSQIERFSLVRQFKQFHVPIDGANKRMQLMVPTVTTILLKVSLSHDFRKTHKEVKGTPFFGTVFGTTLETVVWHRCSTPLFGTIFWHRFLAPVLGTCFGYLLSLHQCVTPLWGTTFAQVLCQPSW